MASALIPGSPEALTPNWLTSTLRDAGVLRDARVASHVATLLETQGAAGIVARVALAYDLPEHGAPPSIIAKFASPYEPIRALMHAFGGYAREVEFYRHFGADPGVPTARCYYAEIDHATGAFVLLLEDMGACRISDPLQPTVEDAETAVRHLAAFHAKWWDHPRLRELPFLRYPGETADATFRAQARMALAAALPVVTQRFGSALPQILIVLAERMLANMERALDTRNDVLASGVTLVHGDFHPGQLFYPSERGGRFAVFDWQTVSAGSGGDDLARIVTLGLSVEQRERHDGELVALYHALLAEHGVRGYTIEQCWQAYRQGLMMSALINVIAGASIDPDLPDPLTGMSMLDASEFFFGRSAAAIEAHNALDLVPA